MKKKEFETYLQRLYPEFYALAMVARPDTSEATELLNGTLWIIFNERREILEDFTSETLPALSEDAVSRAVYTFKLAFIREMYRLAISQEYFSRDGEGMVAEGELDLSLFKDIESRFFPFYRLSADQRLSLFMRSKTSMSWDDMAFVFDRPRYHLMVSVMQARVVMAIKMGLSFEKRFRSVPRPESTSESTYLYHEESREQYLESFRSRENCRFSKNTYSLMDSDEASEDDFSQFKKHLTKCSTCQDELSFVKNTFNQIDMKVPLFRVKREIQLEFEQDLNEFLRDYSLPHGLQTFLRPLIKSMKRFSIS